VDNAENLRELNGVPHAFKVHLQQVANHP
jgi:hypothetical protein